MDYAIIDDFISKTANTDFNDIFRGFKIGDCVEVSNKLIRGRNIINSRIIGCIMDIHVLQNTFLRIYVKECSSNITFVFNDFDKFKKVECNKC